MKGTITVVMLLVCLLFTSNVFGVWPDADKNINTNINTNKNNSSAESKSKSLAAAGAAAKSTLEQTIEGDVTPVDPAPLLDIPGFVSIPLEAVEARTQSPFVMNKTEWTQDELKSFANPAPLLNVLRIIVLGENWNKDFDIDLALWDKAASEPNIMIVQFNGDPNVLAETLKGKTKMGEGSVKAKDTSKSERQSAAALAFKASKKGATVAVVHMFSNVVAVAETAVIGGGGANYGGDEVLNAAGGFGKSTGEKEHKSVVIAEFYK
jgi:hypothetical protein